MMQAEHYIISNSCWTFSCQTNQNFFDEETLSKLAMAVQDMTSDFTSDSAWILDFLKKFQDAMKCEAVVSMSPMMVANDHSTMINVITEKGSFYILCQGWKNEPKKRRRLE